MKIIKLETDHKIAKSNKLNQHKLRRISDKNKCIETTVAEVLKELFNKHCFPTNAAYKELLKKFYCKHNAIDFRMKLCFEETLPMIKQKMLCTTDKIKFTYFPFPARGEQVRMLLRYAKVPFKD